MCVFLSILSLTLIYAVKNQSGFVEHSIRRIQAYYIAKAGLVHALEVLRIKGSNPTTSASSGPGTTNPCAFYVSGGKQWMEAIVSTKNVSMKNSQTTSTGISYNYIAIDSTVDYSYSG